MNNTFKLLNLLSGLSKTLNIAKNIIPIYKDTKPVINNLRNLYKNIKPINKINTNIDNKTTTKSDSSKNNINPNFFL